MSHEPPQPNSSRLIDWGHSWVAPPPYVYAVSNIAAGSTLPWDGEQWPNALRDALGIGTSGSYYKTYTVPAVAAGTSLISILDALPGDCTIDDVWYIPAGALTGANTNTRELALSMVNASQAFAVQNFTSGINLASTTPYRLFSMNGGNYAQNATLTNAVVGPYTPALVASGASVANAILVWESNKVGTGLADLGGQVVVRYGTRYRNYAVAGATLLGNSGVNLFPPGIASGGWLSTLSWSAWSKPNAVEVNLTAASASGVGSLTCSPLAYPLPSGSVVYFAGGTTATLTAGANFKATTITCAGGPTANLAAGQQGHGVTGGSGGGTYETLSPTAINVWTMGINDVVATQDTNAWIETSRSVMAKNLCPCWDYGYSTTNQMGNFLYTNGGGTWAGLAPPAAGSLPYLLDPVACSAGNVTQVPFWTGTVSGSPSVAISVGPAFEGGTVDLIFLAAAGSSLGVAGTITVDGTTPPQGTVTINTSGVSTSGLMNSTLAGTITAAASATLTGASTNFTQAMVGQLFTASSGTVPAGTIITAVASTTSATVSNTVTLAAATGSISQWVPMVKRITGLASGAHTITFTITGSASVANSVIGIYGLGLESQNPPTPVLWCNIAGSPSLTSGQKTNAIALNAASLSVINGTATPLTGNTTEPAFGTNVQYVDLYTLFGGATPTTALFLSDGLHPNSRGHRLIARTLFTVLRNNFSPDELIAR